MQHIDATRNLSNDTHVVVIQPTELDILYGRDDFSIHHIGNVSFRTLIACCLKEYSAIPNSKRSSRGEFLTIIVCLIVTAGGRFLKRQHGNGNWEEVNTKAARQKVGQELRDMTGKPHILKNFTLIQSGCMKSHYGSARDFDWCGIVQACKLEMEQTREWDDDDKCLEVFFHNVLAS